jgi:hypothetical protein
VESECLWCKVGLEWECDLEHFEGCLVGEVKREGVSGVLASKQVQWFKGVLGWDITEGRRGRVKHHPWDRAHCC